MFFQRILKADINGVCFREYLKDPVTKGSLRRVFGAPSEGFWDDDAGYDGEDWIFVDESMNVYKVYARFGHLRVGAHPHTDVSPFMDWLAACLTEWDGDAKNA